MTREPETPFTIDSLGIRVLDLPLANPFTISSGTCRRRRSIIVEMRSGGVVGYGEAAPLDEPFYSEETVSSVLALYRDLYLPRLEGRTFGSLDEFDQELGRGVRGNRFARAGIETSAWDLICRQRGTSIVELIEQKLRARGLPPELCRPRDRIECGVSIGIPAAGPNGSGADRRSILADQVRTFRAEGYRRVKLKIKPGWDVEACHVARDILGEGFPLATDANGGFDLRAHLHTFQAMDELGLVFHEQPLHHEDLLDHASLARSLRTPICLDESLRSVRLARQAHEVGASHIWNVKVQRLGGLSECLRVYQLAARLDDVTLWVGTMPESGMGSRFTLALAAFPLFRHPTDLEPSTRWFDPGVDPLELPMAPDGTLEVPRHHGIEAVLDPGLYERHARSMY